MNELTLIVVLLDGRQIAVPNLSEETLNAIFTAYSTYLESDRPAEPPMKGQMIIQKDPSGADMMKPMGKFNFNAFDPSGLAMQHNPLEANSPEFPREVLDKIAAIANIVAPEDAGAIPYAEPNCNCPHCQIARAIHQGVSLHGKPTHPENVELVHAEEIVEEKDLNFSEWDIKQTGENLYDVTNRLDTNETYHVFLGTPVGCTCGKSGCEHILAVLKS
jgi:hypothetical protein